MTIEELEKFFKEYKEQGSRQYKLKYLCEYCERVGILNPTTYRGEEI